MPKRDAKKDPRPGDATAAKTGEIFRVFANNAGTVHYWEGNDYIPQTVSIEEWRKYSAEDTVLHVAE